MSTPVRIALIGFTKFERATFESFFRLAAKRTPAYALAESVSDCDAAVVNADDGPGVLEVVHSNKLHCTMMLGATPRPGAALQLQRPINLMLIVRALDRMVQQAAPTPAANLVDSGVSPTVQRVLDDLAHATTTIEPGVDTRALARNAAPASAPASAAAAAPLPQDEPERPGMDHILVVDDSDIALRFMASHLQRFGFMVHLARSGTEAIERVAKRHFEFVFLDVMMEGMDGFLTCKAIKRNTYPNNRPPPTVVMLTSRGTAVDKMRGTMAGADAYLTKPMREEELLKVVGDREIAKHAYAETAHASTTLI